MQVSFWVTGKTTDTWLQEGVLTYKKRLDHYLPFSMDVLLIRKKGLSSAQMKREEADLILKKLNTSDFLVLLDERGKMYSSKEFAKFVDAKLQLTYNRLIFLVGGAYGFDERIYDRANTKLSLSKMTFSHQMVRLFFLEQLYRAMTILRNEPYHH